MLDDQIDAHELNPEPYRNYLRLLARIWIPRSLRRKLDASDIVQMTMLKALRKGHQVANPEKHRAWLRSVLRNTLLDEVTKHCPPDRSRTDIEHASWLIESWLADNTPSAVTCMANEELLEALALALDRLPEDWQQVIVLHHIQGLKVAEVAKELGRTRASVAGSLRRGLKQLRDAPQLRHCFGEE